MIVTVPFPGGSHKSMDEAGSVYMVSESAQMTIVLSSGMILIMVSVTGVTVTTTKAVSQSGGSPSSHIAYIKLSTPTKSSSGIYVIVLSPGLTVAVPNDGGSETTGMPNGLSISLSLSNTSMST